jgi:hypothetical protein
LTVLDPATPGNLGAGCIKTPKATGWLPTWIIAITVFVAVSITDTVLPFRFAGGVAGLVGIEGGVVSG